MELYEERYEAYYDVKVIGVQEILDSLQVQIWEESQQTLIEIIKLMQSNKRPDKAPLYLY